VCLYVYRFCNLRMSFGVRIVWLTFESGSSLTTSESSACSSPRSSPSRSITPLAGRPVRLTPSEKHTLHPLISNHQRRSNRRVAGRKCIAFMSRWKACMRVYHHPDFVLYPVTPTVHARILPVLFCTHACSPSNSTEVCADTLFVSCKLRAPLAGLGFRV